MNILKETKRAHKYIEISTSTKNYGKRYLSKIQSTKDRGIEFKLTFKQYKKLLKTKRCVYTRKLFDTMSEGSLTLERVNNGKGYTKKNTVAVRKDINSFKDKLDFKDIISMCKFLKKKYENKRS